MMAKRSRPRATDKNLIPAIPKIGMGTGQVLSIRYRRPSNEGIVEITPREVTVRPDPESAFVGPPEQASENEVTRIMKSVVLQLREQGRTTADINYLLQEFREATIDQLAPKSTNTHAPPSPTSTAAITGWSPISGNL